MGTLIDRFKRDHTYLRISVTDRCDLRCSYCRPSIDPYFANCSFDKTKPLRRQLLSFEEIEELSHIFVELGIRKIRITGGEPLMRKNITNLCGKISSIPNLSSLGLSTNGTHLASLAMSLQENGVSTVNISLDSLREERFKQITERDVYADVIRGIEAAINTGFESVKINTVIMRGINDDELFDFIDFAAALSLNVRLIEYMPFPGNRWNESSFVSYSEMRSKIESRYTLTPIRYSGSVSGPSKDYSVDGTDAVVGFITTMSDHFCGSCNRLRLTADGRLRTCLFSPDSIDLKYLLRSGSTRGSIEYSIREAVLMKWEKHPDRGNLVEFQDRSMTSIGG
jgi:molybdenum cofactor biosynthesis protein A